MSIKTEIEWFTCEDTLPPERKEVLIAYVFNYCDDEEMDLLEFSRGQIVSENDDELAFKLPNNIWRINCWAHNQIDKTCLIKYKIKYWAYLPSLPEFEE